MAEIPSCVRKFFKEETDAGSTLSECLLTDMAAGLNAMCNFTENIRCEMFTSSGTYTTKPKTSNLFLIAAGGGGAGGGGANGSVLYFPINGSFNANAVDIGPLRLLAQGQSGFDGTAGGDTIFDGQIIAKGGNGGHGGRVFLPGTILPQYTPVRGWGNNEDRVYLQEAFDNLQLSQRRDGPMLDGVVVGSSSEGGVGTASIETRFNRDTNLWGGGKGFWGAPGEIGFRCFQAAPATTYSFTIGAGGIGGPPAPDTVNGGDVVSGAVGGTNAQAGGLLIFEMGF